jgi:hypothetical protein
LDKLIASPRSGKVLLFITKNFVKLGIFIDVNRILNDLMSATATTFGDDRQFQFVKDYVKLFDNKNVVQVEYLLHKIDFESLNLFLFFFERIHPAFQNDISIFRRIALEQTNLGVVKWLLNNKVGADFQLVAADFIYRQNKVKNNDDDDFYLTHGVTNKYFNGENLETLILLIQRSGDQDYSILQKIMDRNYRLFFRLLVRNSTSLQCIITNVHHDVRHELRVLRELLNQYFPSSLSQIILLNF